MRVGILARWRYRWCGKIVIGGKWLNLRHEPTALLCRFDWRHLGIVHTKYALCARFAQSLPRISELNLPRIAAQSILGLGRWRFGRVCKPPLLSPAAPVLCFTEPLSPLTSNSNAISQWKIAYTSLSEDHLRSLYFYICAGIMLCRNVE